MGAFGYKNKVQTGQGVWTFGGVQWTKYGWIVVFHLHNISMMHFVLNFAVLQEVNQALMSAVSKNLLISFFVRSVVPVITETMLKTAGLIHQNVYEEIFKFSDCRHGTSDW